MSKPNILVFVTDQHCFRWMGYAGDPVLKTPALDDLAAGGLIFENAYCETPLCMPSRATLWTGQTPRGHGVRTNGVDLDDDALTLPRLLGSAGYQTISVGKIHVKSWHLAPEKSPQVTDYDPVLLPECETPWKRGTITRLPKGFMGLDKTHFLGGHGSYCFGEYFNGLQEEHPQVAAALRAQESTQPTLCPNTYFSTVPEELYYTEWITRRTIESIDARDPDRPFFLWCSNPDPHFPFGPPAPWSQMYHADQVPDPVAFDDPRADMPGFYHTSWYRDRGIHSTDGGPDLRSLQQIKETKALVYGMISLLDKSVGRIVEHLKRKGLYENTLIVFLADHGELMGDHGLFCKGPFHYESLIRVPLFFHLPRLIPGGYRTTALASLLDFVPTVLDVCGVEVPQGHVPDWPGPFKDHRDYADGGIYKGVSRLPGRSLRPILEGKAASVQDSVLVEDDDDIRGLCLRTLVTRDFKLTLLAGRDDGMLIDLRNDPDERRNLFADQRVADVRARLCRQLLDRIIETEPRVKRRIGIA